MSGAATYAEHWAISLLKYSTRTGLLAGGGIMLYNRGGTPPYAAIEAKKGNLVFNVQNEKLVAYEPATIPKAGQETREVTLNDGKKKLLIVQKGKNDEYFVVVDVYNGTSPVKELIGQSVVSPVPFKEWPDLLDKSTKFANGKVDEIQKQGTGTQLFRGVMGTGVDGYKGFSKAVDDEKASAGAPRVGDRNSPWDYIKEYLPFIGPIAGVVVAALGNFSTPMILAGVALAAGGIFAEKIEKSVDDATKTREAKAAGGTTPPKAFDAPQLAVQPDLKTVAGKVGDTMPKLPVTQATSTGVLQMTPASGQTDKPAAGVAPQ